MKYNLKCLLTLCLIIFFSEGFTKTAFANVVDTTIIQFFKERITDINNNSLITFDEKLKLKAKDIEKSEQYIWNLWKEANKKFDRLPHADMQQSKNIEDFSRRKLCSIW